MKSKILSLVLILVVLLGLSIPSRALTEMPRGVMPDDIRANSSELAREVDSISEKVFTTAGIIGGIIIVLGIVFIAVPVIIIVIVVKKRSKKGKENKEEQE